MERSKQYFKGITIAVLNGASAVCSSIVATGLASGLSSKTTYSLSFFLNPLISIF